MWSERRRCRSSCLGCPARRPLRRCWGASCGCGWRPSQAPRSARPRGCWCALTAASWLTLRCPLWRPMPTRCAPCTAPTWDGKLHEIAVTVRERFLPGSLGSGFGCSANVALPAELATDGPEMCPLNSALLLHRVEQLRGSAFFIRERLLPGSRGLKGEVLQDMLSDRLQAKNSSTRLQLQARCMCWNNTGRHLMRGSEEQPMWGCA